MKEANATRPKKKFPRYFTGYNPKPEDADKLKRMSATRDFYLNTSMDGIRLVMDLPQSSDYKRVIDQLNPGKSFLRYDKTGAEATIIKVLDNGDLVENQILLALDDANRMSRALLIQELNSDQVYELIYG